MKHSEKANYKEMWNRWVDSHTGGYLVMRAGGKPGGSPEARNQQVFFFGVTKYFNVDFIMVVHQVCKNAKIHTHSYTWREDIATDKNLAH